MDRPPLIPNEHDMIVQRDLAIDQLKFARQYLFGMLEGIAPDEWSIIPPGATSHLAWQIGHLAVAEYGLLLFRQRGRAEGDIELMPGWLRKNYGRGSKATTDRAAIPSSETLLELLDAIHRRAMEEARHYPASLLAEPAEMPYAVYPIKLGAILFAPLHESIHIGQIGMLRRMLGKEPVR